MSYLLASPAYCPSVISNIRGYSMTTTVIALVALVISVASLAFGVYQYRILHKVRMGEKATALVRLAQDLRRKSEDLKHLIGCTDDVDDCSELLTKVNGFVDEVVPKLALSKDRSLEDLFEIEQHLHSLELEIDLLHKQVAEVGRWNEEVRQYEARKAACNEL
jgi:hypothetical protein